MNRIACVSLLTCILSGVVSICNGNVNVDSNGTRILSKVPPVGVHPRRHAGNQRAISVQPDGSGYWRYYPETI
jgi:urocanate hydratase